MQDQPSALRSLGLNQEGGLLKGAYVTHSGGKPVLHDIFEIQLTEGEGEEENVKPLYKRKEGAKLQGLLDECIVVTGLDSADVLTRHLQLELTKDRDIDAVIHFQAEPLLPYPVEEAVVDWVKQRQDKEGTDLSIMATRSDSVETHLKQWHALAIEPEVVSCAPAALASFAKIFGQSEDPIYVVDIGLSSATCIIACGGKLLATQSSLKGIHHLFEALIQDQPEATIELFYSLDFAHVEESLQPHLAKAVARLRTEVAKTLFALGKQIQEKTLSQVLVTGVGGVIRSLAGALCQGLNLSVIIPEETPTFSLPPSQLQRYAIPIGYALSGLPNHGSHVNFRQESFAYPDPWKRLRKPLLSYFAAAFFLAISLYLYNQSSIASEVAQIRENYGRLLESIQQPFLETEKSFSAKTGLPIANSLKSLSQEDISFRIQFINQQFAEAPQFFPLQPNIPNVSDLLAWLSTHPQIASGDEGQPHIQLESISYKLAKRPEKKKMRERYQVKVELELSASAPRFAREFYDSLIAPNEMVDPNFEVKWSASREKYRTTFFLKDRTVYP